MDKNKKPKTMFVIQVIFGDGSTRIRKEAFYSRKAAVDFCNTQYQGMTNMFSFSIHEVNLP